MAKLGDICFQITDGSHNPPAGIENSKHLMLSSKNINDDEITTTAPRFLTDEQFDIENKRTNVPSGDLLMTIVGTVGRVAVVPEMLAGICLQRSVAVIKPNPTIINNRYLMYQLQSMRKFLESEARGVAQKGIYLKQVGDLSVITPPLDEQYRVVDTLDHISGLIHIYQQQLTKLDELIKARFVEMFGDFKSNSKGWSIVKFDEFAQIDGNMTTDYEKYADYPHIGIDSIEKETGTLKGYRTVKEDGVVSGKYFFTPQHIIYSKIRPNLNKVALPDFEGLCSADAYPILPNPKNCNRVFLALAMRSNYFLDYILQFSARTNLPKVNRKEIAGFSMPLPPLPLQNQFADFVAEVDKSKLFAELFAQNACILAENRSK